jgi:hypothetical protein
MAAASLGSFTAVCIFLRPCTYIAMYLCTLAGGTDVDADVEVDVDDVYIYIYICRGNLFALNWQIGVAVVVIIGPDGWAALPLSVPEP